VSHLVARLQRLLRRPTRPARREPRRQELTALGKGRVSSKCCPVHIPGASAVSQMPITLFCPRPTLLSHPPRGTLHWASRHWACSGCNVQRPLLLLRPLLPIHFALPPSASGFCLERALLICSGAMHAPFIRKEGVRLSASVQFFMTSAAKLGSTLLLTGRLSPSVQCELQNHCWLSWRRSRVSGLTKRAPMQATYSYSSCRTLLGWEMELSSAGAGAGAFSSVFAEDLRPASSACSLCCEIACEELL
jgi:hypothetical protein